MISPSIGYPQTTNPVSARARVGLQAPAAAPVPRGIVSSSADTVSALLSSLTGAGSMTGPLPSLATRVNAAFGNPQGQQLLVEQIISANAVRQPSVESNKSALRAYLQALQSELGSGPEAFGSGRSRVWFA